MTLLLAILLVNNVNSVTPSHGHPGDIVTISGTEFRHDVGVYFGEHRSEVYSVSKDGTELKVVVPKGTGIVDIKIISPAYPKTIVKQAFTYD